MHIFTSYCDVFQQQNLCNFCSEGMFQIGIGDFKIANILVIGKFQITDKNCTGCFVYQYTSSYKPGHRKLTHWVGSSNLQNDPYET